MPKNKSNNHPSKRIFRVSWNNGDFPIEITNQKKSTTWAFIPKNFIHNSGYYLLQTADYPKYIHDQVWKFIKQHQKETNIPEIDLKKTTEDLLIELKCYCLESYTRLSSFGERMTSFEKGKCQTMLEVGKKLEKILYEKK